MTRSRRSSRSPPSCSGLACAQASRKLSWLPGWGPASPRSPGLKAANAAEHEDAVAICGSHRQQVSRAAVGGLMRPLAEHSVTTSPGGKGRIASTDAIRVRGYGPSLELRPLTRIAPDDASHRREQSDSPRWRDEPKAPPFGQLRSIRRPVGLTTNQPTHPPHQAACLTRRTTLRGRRLCGGRVR